MVAICQYKGSNLLCGRDLALDSKRSRSTVNGAVELTSRVEPELMRLLQILYASVELRPTWNRGAPVALAITHMWRRSVVER